jgi:hypothetical protein
MVEAESVNELAMQLSQFDLMQEVFCFYFNVVRILSE